MIALINVNSVCENVAVLPGWRFELLLQAEVTFHRLELDLFLRFSALQHN